MPPPIPPLPSVIAMPLRDALRGVRRTVSSGSKLAEPVESSLPDPMREILHGLMTRVKTDMGRATGLRRGDSAALDGIAQLGGLARDRASVTVFARVAHCGLSLALDQLDRADLMVSETVCGLAYRTALGGLDDNASEAERAAAVAMELVSQHSIGVAPGTGVAMSESDYAVTRTAVVGLMLWVLAARDGPDGDEAELLDLCVDLALGLATEVPDTTPALSAFLARHAAHI